MIILIGHGYIGKAIKKELEIQNVEHIWIKHSDPYPCKRAIINATGFTGVPT